MTQLNNNVQGVVSSNDGNAGAAVASMEEQGMAGTVPVSGLIVQSSSATDFVRETNAMWLATSRGYGGSSSSSHCSIGKW